MSKRRANENSAPFQPINTAAQLTGLSRDYLRKGIKSGQIPAIRIGSGNNAPYLIDVQHLMEQLHQAASKGGLENERL